MKKIVNITLDNVDELNNSFISKKYIINELKNNPFAKFLLLKEDDYVIGYIYYSDIYDRAEINQFEIEKTNRFCGKGNFLLNKMINSVEKDITLEVRKDNYPAIELYKKNGFVEKAIRKKYYNGIDGLLLERKYRKEW